MDSRFSEKKYVVRRKVMALVGAQFHIYNEAGQLMFFSKQKAFKLKEDIRLYTGEDMSEEVLTMKARTAIDFSATYDVVDSKDGTKIGALQRKGMKSILKDEWLILNANDVQVGIIQEDSMLLAIIRRFLSNLVPQNFDVLVDGKKIIDLKQAFNPFIYRLTIDMSLNTDQAVDNRIAIAAGVLIAAIEGRQN